MTRLVMIFSFISCFSVFTIFIEGASFMPSVSGNLFFFAGFLLVSVGVHIYLSIRYTYLSDAVKSIDMTNIKSETQHDPLLSDTGKALLLHLYYPS